MMNPKTRDLVATCAFLVIIWLGAVAILIPLMRDYSTDDEMDFNDTEYVSDHRLSSLGVVLVAVGLALLTFRFLERERPLWADERPQHDGRKRSSVVISIGIALSVFGLGMSLVLIHQNYAVPGWYDVPHEWIVLALYRAILGFVGIGILIFGLIFYRVPDLEFGDEKSLFRRRPKWQGGAVILIGVLIALATLHNVPLYDENHAIREHTDEMIPLMIFLLGMIASILTCVVGLIMLAERPPVVRPQPFPYEPDSSQKRARY